MKYFIFLISVFVLWGCDSSFDTYINKCENNGGKLTACDVVSGDYVGGICCVKNLRKFRTSSTALVDDNLAHIGEPESFIIAAPGRDYEHIINIDFKSGEVLVNEKYTSQQLAREFLRAIPDLVEQIRAIPCDQRVKFGPLVNN